MTKHKTKKAKIETLTISKVDLWKIISGVLGLILLVSVFTGGLGIKASLLGLSAGAQQEQEAADDEVVDAVPSGGEQPSQGGLALNAAAIALLVDDDAVKGNANAPVTIVEWSDYECPFCARFYTETLGQIDELYIQTGKVKFVYRDFPLPPRTHPNAQKAAEAAECAGEQDKYWEMHDALFDSGVSGGVTAFKQYAIDIGLDNIAFNSCLDSGDMAAEVAKDLQDGQAAGVGGTPSFLINGQLIVGAQPFEVLQQVIEGELAK
ncbi:MAG: DsbA family protein [Candidatus Altiarchaeota archaeon]|nr:DsbA family protein [Candidatus Altiarchaeota archaeon]